MPKSLLTYRCLVISPSDVPEHRDAVERAIHAWNAQTGPMFNARIEPVRWESHVSTRTPVDGIPPASRSHSTMGSTKPPPAA